MLRLICCFPVLSVATGTEPTTTNNERNISKESAEWQAYAILFVIWRVAVLVCSEVSVFAQQAQTLILLPLYQRNTIIPHTTVGALPADMLPNFLPLLYQRYTTDEKLKKK